MAPEGSLGGSELWASEGDTCILSQCSGHGAPEMEGPRTTFASRPIKSAQVNILAQMIFAPINTSVFSAWNLGPETAESSQPAFPVPSFPACYDQRTLSKGQTALVDATTISPSCSALSFHRGCPARLGFFKPSTMSSTQYLSPQQPCGGCPLCTRHSAGEAAGQNFCPQPCLCIHFSPL